MRHSKCVLLLVSLALAGPSIAAAQAPEAKSDLAANAAVQYWQAFAQMPTLDKDQEIILGEWSTVSLDDAAVQKLVAGSHNSLRYLHRAAKLQRCDWGLDYSDGLGLMLPHLAKARDLARLAALHARYEFERGNRGAVRDDATAIMMLGRNVGRDPLLISILVRYLIEDIAIDLVAPYVPEIKAPRAHAAAMFDALPKAPAFAQSIDGEKRYFVQWMIKELKDAEQKKPGSWQDTWKSFFGPEAIDASVKVDTFEEAVKWTEGLLPIYDELQKIVALPKDEFETQYRAFKQRTKANNPMADVVLPTVDKVLAKEHRNRARLAMLLAAIAVAQDGPEKLKDIQDPFGTGPFEHREIDGGFELKSKLQFEGQPVTLKVGRGKQG